MGKDVSDSKISHDEIIVDVERTPEYKSLEDFIKGRMLQKGLYQKGIKSAYEELPEPDPSDALDLLFRSIASMYSIDTAEEKKDGASISAINNSAFEHKVAEEELDNRRNLNYIRNEERRLIAYCNSIGIDHKLFQEADSKRYQMIPDVVSLFSYILDNLFVQRGKHRRPIKNPSKESLIEIRVKLIDALCNLGYDKEAVQDHVMRFEKKTGCPPKREYIQHSQLTEEVAQYMREDIQLSEIEWDLFMDQVEYEYQVFFKSEFKKRCMKIVLRDFLQQIGKEGLYPYFGADVSIDTLLPFRKPNTNYEFYRKHNKCTHYCFRQIQIKSKQVCDTEIADISGMST